MCINCNIFCPISHSLCDILGIEKNKYGLATSSVTPLNDVYLHQLYPGTDISKEHENTQKLYAFLKQNELLDLIEKYDVVNRNVINYAFYQFFSFNTESITNIDDLLKSFKIPVELLCNSNDVERFKEYFKIVNYVQIEQIPVEKLLKFNVEKEDFIKDAELYGIKLLDEPF
jgi:hypothetical protein